MGLTVVLEELINPGESNLLDGLRADHVAVPTVVRHQLGVEQPHLLIDHLWVLQLLRSFPVALYDLFDLLAVLLDPK